MNKEEIADYTAGYDDCMADMMQTLDEIRAEIKTKMNLYQTWDRSDYQRYAEAFKECLEIIDKHIGECGIAMADIELVIKIPEHAYEECKKAKLTEALEGVPFHVMKAIANSTPLPKSHGRLKDIDAFISKVQADRQHAVYTRSWTADDVLNALTNSYAPTIIETDKE